MREHVDEARRNCQSFGVNDGRRNSATQVSDGGDSITFYPYVCFYRRPTSSVINSATPDNDVELLLRDCEAGTSLRVRQDCQRQN